MPDTFALANKLGACALNHFAMVPNFKTDALRNMQLCLLIARRLRERKKSKITSIMIEECHR